MTTKALSRVNYDEKPAGVAGLQTVGKNILPAIQAALPGFLAKHSERFLRALVTECQRTPRLMECSMRSLFGAVIQTAQLGLELGGPLGQAYIIPFGREAALVVGYKGFITLAHRTGRIASITPRIVRAGDEFQIAYGSDQKILHLPRIGDDGKVGSAIGYYTVFRLDNGGTDFEFMTRSQCEEHRDKHALAKKGPWADKFDEMALKTTVRRLAKRMPLSPELACAVGLDEQAEADVSQGLAALVEPDAAPNQVDDLKTRLDNVGTDPDSGTPTR